MPNTRYPASADADGLLALDVGSAGVDTLLAKNTDRLKRLDEQFASLNQLGDAVGSLAT